MGRGYCLVSFYTKYEYYILVWFILPLENDIMSRDVFGNKKITKEDMYTKKLITDADVRVEYYKGFIWFVAGYSYFHFVIMGWSW